VTSGAEDSSPPDSAAAALAVFVLRGRELVTRFFFVSPAAARADGVSSSVFGGSAIEGF
jgi:hypothetical protein